MNTIDPAAKHQQRMQKVKQQMDRKIAQAAQERGIIVLLTGNDKGKSSSAFGMLARNWSITDRICSVSTNVLFATGTLRPDSIIDSSWFIRFAKSIIMSPVSYLALCILSSILETTCLGTKESMFPPNFAISLSRLELKN